MNKCLECDGFGDIWDEDGTDSQTCPWCYGSGEAEDEIPKTIEETKKSKRSSST